MNRQLCALMLLAYTGNSLSRAGDLDPTFGNGTGIVLTELPIGPDDILQDIKIQSDNKIIAGGYTGSPTIQVFAMTRYNTDGSLDASFGIGGFVSTDFGGSNIDRSTKILLQPDSKIILTGRAGTGAVVDFALARYLTDGSLDLSFGTGGLVTTSFTSAAISNASVLQTDGKIVLVGNSGMEFALARYLTDGTLDTSFNPTGINPGTLTTSFGIGSTSTPFAIAQQSDGKIITAGNTNAGPNILDYALARYNTDGSLDSSFNPIGPLPGTLISDFVARSEAFSIALQPNGKILVGGRIGNPGAFQFLLARYNIDGSLDTSFGTNGFVATSVGPDMDDRGLAVVLQPDGKIIMGGTAFAAGSGDFGIVRFLNDGTIDITFGINGKVVTNPPGTLGGLNSLALQSDGRIVGAGFKGFVATDRFFVIARYLNDTLTITKEASSQTPCPGQNITYTITATNFGAGGGVVNGIFIEDLLPPEVTFRSAKTKGATSNFDSATLVWSIPRLCIDESATLKINARVQQFAGNQILCNTAITTYSSVDNVTDSSLFDSLGISSTEIFSTTECISTLPVLYENPNHIANRADCGTCDLNGELCNVENKIDTIEKQQVLTDELLNKLLLKLDCVLGF